MRDREDIIAFAAFEEKPLSAALLRDAALRGMDIPLQLDK
jgi:hypothetical protein